MRKLLLLFIFSQSVLLYSQDSLKLQNQKANKVIYADETFKASRIILGQSIENPPNGVLTLLISHHFGALNSGFYNFFGLDQSSTRLGIEY